jgi:predicted permease
LRRGRVFTELDGPTAPLVVVINEAFVQRYLPKEDPLGRRIQIGKGLGPEFEDPSRQIVGVVGDVREGGLKQTPQPVMYIPVGQVPDGLMRLGNQILPTNWIVRTATSPLSLIAAVQREFLAVDAQLPVTKVRTMEQVISEGLARENFNMLLLSIFAAIALLLAAIGIYGVMSYAVERRTHEIGIRMALGAGRRETLRLVIGQGMRLAAAGVAIGLAAAFGLTRLLSSLLFGIRPTDLFTFIVVPAVLCFVAFLATYIPALRATRVDPVIALRYE